MPTRSALDSGEAGRFRQSYRLLVHLDSLLIAPLQRSAKLPVPNDHGHAPEIMITHGFTMFDTTIGRCAIAWGGRGIVGVQLPELSDRATRDRVIKHIPDAREVGPPPEVQRTMDGITAVLHGDPSDLSTAVLDMERVPLFHRRVYEVARCVACGDTLTYGEVAARLGDRGKARAVGRALGRNPFAIIVPCHRVLASNGKVGGFSASGGVAMKLRLLSIEAGRATRGLGLFDVPVGLWPPGGS